MARSASRDSKNRGNSEKSRPLTDPPRAADFCPTQDSSSRPTTQGCPSGARNPESKRRLLQEGPRCELRPDPEKRKDSTEALNLAQMDRRVPGRTPANPTRRAPRRGRPCSFNRSDVSIDDAAAALTAAVPKPGIELGTHGSSGHVFRRTRNQATTRTRRNVVMHHDKWFNESGEQALRLDTRGCAAPGSSAPPIAVRRASDLQIDERDRPFAAADSGGGTRVARAHADDWDEPALDRMAKHVPILVGLAAQPPRPASLHLGNIEHSRSLSRRGADGGD